MKFQMSLQNFLIALGIIITVVGAVFVYSNNQSAVNAAVDTKLTIIQQMVTELKTDRKADRNADEQRFEALQESNSEIKQSLSDLMFKNGSGPKHAGP